MEVTTSLDMLIDFVTYRGLENRMYLSKDATGTLQLGNAKGKCRHILCDLVHKALLEVKASGDDTLHAEFDCAVELLSAHLLNRSRRLTFRSLFSRHYSERLASLSKSILIHKSDINHIVTTSRMARMRFFQQFAKTAKAGILTPGFFRRFLGGYKGDHHEYRMIATISDEIFKRTVLPRPYNEAMKHFMKGSHIVFIEHDRDSSLLNRLKSSPKLEGNQESSHYRRRRSTVSLVENERNPQQALKVQPLVNSMDHYRQRGSLLSETLFSAEPMAVVNGTLIKGRSYSDVVGDPAFKGQSIEKVYATQLQTECWADYGEVAYAKITPPGKRGRTWKEYGKALQKWTHTARHRTLDFGKYKYRLSKKLPDANVAKWGYGLSDNHAIVL